MSGTVGPASLLGQVVGGYRLARVLGKGATGVVFLGERTEGAARAVEQTGAAPLVLPDQAAIKLLVLPWQLDDAERTEFRKRFLREAETLTKLNHPHVLAVITYGEDQASDSSYMVLPYLTGGTLHDRLSNQTQAMPLVEVSSLLSQVADAVDFAHSKGIVHRDIKPGNILLDGQGQAYLSDFSIARLVVEATTRLTRTGTALGTPIYMSPEALSGEPVGPATDVYSLGMVLYEMVTGLRTNATNPPPPPRALRPDLPVPAEAVILRAVEADPRERFASARELAHAFAEGVQGIWPTGFTRRVSGGYAASGAGVGNETTLPAGGVPLPPTKPKRSRSGLVALLSVAATLLVVFSGVALASQAHLWPFGVGPVAQATNTASATARTGPGSSTGQPTNGKSTATTARSTTTSETPTVTPTPLPTLVISADGLQSSDGVAHGAGNPYIFSSKGPYGNVDIQAGAYVTAVNHCTDGGAGTVQFTALGTVTVAGTITVDAEGYCGGQTYVSGLGGYQGQSHAGSSQQSAAQNYGGGGGGDGADSGGAGGSYGTAGQPGQNANPSGAGAVYGDPSIATLYLGSGGGSSGRQTNAAAGGNGGGAVSITASSISVSGTISANGGNGQSVQQGSDTTNFRGGGGGSGGSILLTAHTFSITGSVVANGGSGGFGTHDDKWPAGGGNGGAGRIRYVHT
jgi:serine/threonine-protein kinase